MRRGRPALDTPAQDNLQICNTNALVAVGKVGGRCSAVDALDPGGAIQTRAESFSVRFVLEQSTDGLVDPIRNIQNVVGWAEYRGRRFDFRRAQWTIPGGRKLEFRGRDDDNIVLEVVLVRREPDAPSASFRISDQVEGGDEDSVRAQLGPATNAILGGVNQIATVQDSTLALSTNTTGRVTGAWRGTLRQPVAVDRMRGGRCPFGQLFHPDPQRCFPDGAQPEIDSFFAFGCVIADAPRVTAGLAGYQWSNPWSTDGINQSAQTADCGARIIDDSLEVRILSAPRAVPPFIVRFRARLDDIAVGTTLRLDDLNGPVEAYQVPVRAPVFSLEPTGPVVRIENGRLAVERFDLGPTARLLGWLEGRVAQTP